MPKPRLSAQQAEARGSDQINKGRFADRQDAPVTTGIVGDAPRHLNSDEAKAWKEKVHAIPAGVAGDADRITVELTARLLQQFRSDLETMPSSRIALLMNALSRLGLDPQARTKLHVEKSPEKKSTDPLKNFLSAVASGPKQ